LFLDEQIDGGQVVADVVRDDLRLNLVDPAVDVVTALLVQHVTVGVEQLLPLGSGHLLQFLPLTRQLVQTWLDLLRNSADMADDKHGEKFAASSFTVLTPLAEHWHNNLNEPFVPFLILGGC